MDKFSVCPLARKIAAHLEGSCMNSIQGYLEDEDVQDAPNDIEEQVYLLVDLCDECGWWHRLQDLRLSHSGPYKCMECRRDLFIKEDEDEDEDSSDANG